MASGVNEFIRLEGGSVSQKNLNGREAPVCRAIIKMRI